MWEDAKPLWRKPAPAQQVQCPAGGPMSSRLCRCSGGLLDLHFTRGFEQMVCLNWHPHQWQAPGFRSRVNNIFFLTISVFGVVANWCDYENHIPFPTSNDSDPLSHLIPDTLVISSFVFYFLFKSSYIVRCPLACRQVLCLTGLLLSD